MKYIGENAIKKLISLIKGDLATKQPTITASGLLKGDGAGTITAADTQEATLVDVPNGLLKGDGTTIRAAVAETDYMTPPTGGITGQVLKKTETGTEWANAPQTVTIPETTALLKGDGVGGVAAVTTDATPTQGSTNPVQSGGVYTALSNKLDKTGDGSSVTTAFTAASSRTNIATGEKLSVMFGKIAKWFSDLGSLAFKSTVAKTDLASDVQTSLGKADSALQSYTETDPTVPAWAKAAEKPTYTAAEVGARAADWMPTAAQVGARPSTWTPTKSDVGLSNVDNVKQYSASNPPPYPVTSVNGQTGDVEVQSGSEAASYTVTLTTSGWAQSGSRYAQTVNVTGITASTPVVMVDVDLTGTDLDADAAALEAWGIVSANNVVQGAGTLTFYAMSVPSVNVPVNVGVC